MQAKTYYRELIALSIILFIPQVFGFVGLTSVITQTQWIASLRCYFHRFYFRPYLSKETEGNLLRFTFLGTSSVYFFFTAELGSVIHLMLHHSVSY